MANYRKKPVVIEAFQLTKETRWDNDDWPSWAHLAWNKEIREEGALWPSPDAPNELCISTLEGVMCVGVNDFIIQGVQGELYPCKPDIFEATYEPVE